MEPRLAQPGSPRQGLASGAGAGPLGVGGAPGFLRPGSSELSRLVFQGPRVHPLFWELPARLDGAPFLVSVLTLTGHTPRGVLREH